MLREWGEGNRLPLLWELLLQKVEEIYTLSAQQQWDIGLLEGWNNAVEVVPIGRTKKPEVGARQRRGNRRGQKSGAGGWTRLQPFPDVLGKFHQVIDFLKIRIHFVPVKTKVFVHKDITEARDWRQFPSELRRKHSQFTHAQKCPMVVAGLQSVLNRNDAMADI